MCRIDKNVLIFEHFPPGSIVIFRMRLPEISANALSRIRRDFIEATEPPGLRDALKVLARLYFLTCFYSYFMQNLTLVDYNALFYRCEPEEVDSGGALYIVPGYGPLVYAGFSSLYQLLSNIREGIGNAFFDTVLYLLYCCGAYITLPLITALLNQYQSHHPWIWVTRCSTTSALAIGCSVCSLHTHPLIHSHLLFVIYVSPQAGLWTDCPTIRL
jgi:hypothetical protein